jgi:RNA polymerase sigma-70 factor (ECF subfamily)
VAEGRRLLDRSARGTELTEYHIEAAIAAVHADARCLEETNWSQIVALYDRLLQIRPSPVVALNRAIAVAELEGADRGMEEIRAIDGIERLATYPFYAATLGELELRRGEHERAQAHFQTALSLARSPMERRFFEERLHACTAGGNA